MFGNIRKATNQMLQEMGKGVSYIFHGIFYRLQLVEDDFYKLYQKSSESLYFEEFDPSSDSMYYYELHYYKLKEIYAYLNHIDIQKPFAILGKDIETSQKMEYTYSSIQDDILHNANQDGKELILTKCTGCSNSFPELIKNSILEEGAKVFYYKSEVDPSVLLLVSTAVVSTAVMYYYSEIMDYIAPYITSYIDSIQQQEPDLVGVDGEYYDEL